MEEAGDLLAYADPAEAWRITAANDAGLLPWLTAIATPERLQRPSRLWVFSSVAADRGRPSNYVYGAAKSAFMATSMTIGKGPPALCVSPESVARSLLRRPDRRGIEHLPWWWAPIMVLVRLLPPALACKL